MDTKFYIALIVGLVIYLGALSGLYLVYKPNLDYQKKKRLELKEARKKALETARLAKRFDKTKPMTQESSEPNDSDLEIPKEKKDADIIPR